MTPWPPLFGALLLLAVLVLLAGCGLAWQPRCVGDCHGAAGGLVLPRVEREP